MDETVIWPEEKRCTHCKHLKKASEFSRDRGRKDGLKSWCKTCMSATRKTPQARAYSAAYRKRYDATPKGKAVSRRYGLKCKYGLTPEEYDQMLAAQGGGCAICGRTSGINGRRLDVDHDHSCCPGSRSCGKCVRGLLCTHCNLKILGYWLHEGSKGTEQALAQARRLVAYLEEAGNVRTD